MGLHAWRKVGVHRTQSHQISIVHDKNVLTLAVANAAWVFIFRIMNTFR
jgi:hypothetical protein